MNWIDILNTVVGLTSLLMGGLAIWLSLHMYEKAKESETETAKTLEAIRAQSEALQRLTGRWMDRFTRHATSPRPADEGLMQLVQVVASLPNTILATVDVARHPSQQNVQQLQQEIAASYIALYYYTAIANVLAQNLLPAEDQFDPSNSFHSGVRGMIDSSAADYDKLANLLNGLDRSLITNSSLRHLFDETLAQWSPHVRYTSQVFTQREAGGE
jgi:hypothetical protein